MLSSHPTRPLRGSRAIILQVITSISADKDRAIVSYEELSLRSGYSPNTVKTAIQFLVKNSMLSIEKELGERRNIYRVRHHAG